jgi:predicted peptidase
VSLEPWPEGIAAYPAGGSHELGYIEYLPPGYGAGVAPSPLLVYLHETGQDGTGTEAELHKLLRYGIPRMIADGTWPAEQPFVILTPQYRSADANTRCEVGDYLDEFINFASKAYHIDVTRIYLTGFSCGGIGVWDYFAENGDSQVAAAVSVAGHPMYALQKVGCDFARAPLWVLHGADDDLIPADFLEGKIDDLRSCVGAPSSELKLTILPDAGHEIFQAYDGSAGYDIYSWLLDHKLGK